MDEMLARMMAKGDPYKVIVGSDPDNDKDDRGWNREYLGRVCDLIRAMIADGRVDAHRVYVIGMSMGGFGTIKAVSIAPDLFAACAPDSGKLPRRARVYFLCLYRPSGRTPRLHAARRTKAVG